MGKYAAIRYSLLRRQFLTKILIEIPDGFPNCLPSTNLRHPPFPIGLPTVACVPWTLRRGHKGIESNLRWGSHLTKTSRWNARYTGDCQTWVHFSENEDLRTLERPGPKPISPYPGLFRSAHGPDRRHQYHRIFCGHNLWDTARFEQYFIQSTRSVCRHWASCLQYNFKSLYWKMGPPTAVNPGIFWPMYLLPCLGHCDLNWWSGGMGRSGGRLHGIPFLHCVRFCMAIDPIPLPCRNSIAQIPSSVLWLVQWLQLGH